MSFDSIWEWETRHWGRGRTCKSSYNIYVNDDTINLIGNKTVLVGGTQALKDVSDAGKCSARMGWLWATAAAGIWNFKIGFMDINLDYITVCNLQLGFMDTRVKRVLSTFRKCIRTASITDTRIPQWSGFAGMDILMSCFIIKRVMRCVSFGEHDVCT